ncbi:unnamed protein product [Timema podura]|uniref:Uncharacterized protein n=1 Tax=Timema podura TaxID=61482 RepID=A0ABN7NR78_TIMPD|nr:unnamed protein product [Timema podura]
MKLADNELPLGYKLLTAGVSACIADLTTFPLDTAKVRLQVNTSSIFTRSSIKSRQLQPSNSTKIDMGSTNNTNTWEEAVAGRDSHSSHHLTRPQFLPPRPAMLVVQQGPALMME